MPSTATDKSREQDQKGQGMTSSGSSAGPRNAALNLHVQMLQRRRGWLARIGEAQDRDDYLTMTTLGLRAGRACREAGEHAEAEWHLQLTARTLLRLGEGMQRLLLEAEQVAKTIALAEAWSDTTDPDDLAQPRRLRDRARDLCFTMVQSSRRLDSAVQRVACQLRIATLLSRLGDESDAQHLRQQAAGQARPTHA